MNTKNQNQNQNQTGTQTKETAETEGRDREMMKKGSAQNASQQASETAKKGDPLPADKLRDRSPKQENL